MIFKDVFDVLANARTLFFVGIGGISMSSIAFVFKSKGYAVSGSDRAENAMTRKLSAAGITVHKGHDAANVHGADAVIYTGAVNEQNPEIAEAKRLGIPLVYRADALGYMMKKYETRIGVSGSHGNSTCTAMISHILIAAGKDPVELIRSYGKKLSALHIKDMDKNADPTSPRELPNAIIGEGQCNAEACFRAAYEGGVDTYILEVEYYPCDYKEYIKKSVDAISGFVARI